MTPIAHRVYTNYLNASTNLHGKPDTFNNEAGQCRSSALPQRASLTFALNNHASHPTINNGRLNYET